AQGALAALRREPVRDGVLGAARERFRTTRGGAGLASFRGPATARRRACRMVALRAAETRAAARGRIANGDFMTTTTTGADFRVRDLELAGFGRKEIELAEHEMPGLMAMRRQYQDSGP